MHLLPNRLFAIRTVVDTKIDLHLPIVKVGLTVGVLRFIRIRRSCHKERQNQQVKDEDYLTSLHFLLLVPWNDFSSGSEQAGSNFVANIFVGKCYRVRQ